MDKRKFLKLGLVGLGGVFAAPAIANGVLKGSMISGANNSFQLPDLRYGYDALHPFMDAETVSLLHDNYQAGYTQNLITALKETGTEGKTLRNILTNITNYPETIRVNGGGFFNYRIFWKVLSPAGRKYPDGSLHEAIIRDFGSLENFKSEFSAAANSVRGNGWAWLIIRNGRMKVTATAGHDNPIMSDMPEQGRPLLCLNMHTAAFSSAHGNKSSAYIESFWDFVNWDFVARKYSKVKNLV